jgi:putative restriction endonuclease
MRVIRDEGRDLPYSPSAGYRYDGLYLVDDYWHSRGRASFSGWR